MKKVVNIIGGGPAGLALAAYLDPMKFDVTIHEKNKSAGRKFLVAGKGGFNLTHSEQMDRFIDRYTPPEFLHKALSRFTNMTFRDWLQSIGVPTMIGSSKRVYPEQGIKPIEVLNSILSILETRGISFQYESTWKGWNGEGELLFEKERTVSGDITVFALGGGSWKVTGSDGTWLDTFSEKEITTQSFQASNCQYSVDWPEDVWKRFEGSPLKNIAISSGERRQVGEVVLTRKGLEGNAIYALSPEIRSQFEIAGKAQVHIDLKPTLKLDDVVNILHRSTAKVGDTLKKKLKLSAPMIGLLKSALDRDSYLDVVQLAHAIKAFPVELTGSAEVDEAISTVGGIVLSEVDEHFQLLKLPNTYCIGEMLDWDAPTGGYLLQGCFSMGMFLADHLNKG